ncbi:BnaUnng03110D, partial [Brassica napus]
AVGVLRYQVELSVSDQTDETFFVAFDVEMTKLTNIQAAEADHILHYIILFLLCLFFLKILCVGVKAHVDNELPEFIADIVGKTFIFQLKLVEFNFTHKHQTFTISPLLHSEQGGDHGTDDDMPRENPVASKVSAGDKKTDVELPYGESDELEVNTNAKHQPSSTVVPGGGRPASTKQVVGPNENGKKKARLA